MRGWRTKHSLPVAASYVLVATLSGDAHAFCRSVTVPPPPGYDPIASGCFRPATNPATMGGPVFDLYWKNRCVGYSIQAAASSQVTLADATRLAAQAFAAWSGATCNGGGPPSITAINNGPTQCGLVAYNKNAGNQHVIAFRDNGWPYMDPSNTLALTTLQVDFDTGEILDADMEINSHDFRLSVDGSGPDAGAYDLLGILTHEAGHFLGLAHSDVRGAIMDVHYVPGSTPFSTDDVAGICSFDFSDGTRSTDLGPLVGDACDPTPRGGFSSFCDGSMPSEPPSDPPAPTTTCPSSGDCSAAAQRGGGRGGEWLGLALFGLGAVGVRRVAGRRAARRPRRTSLRGEPRRW
jgi:hypothetical protein